MTQIFSCESRRSESSKGRCMRGTFDPTCLEAIDANMEDWVEDPVAIEGEDLSWMVVSVPSDRSFVSAKVKNVDDCNDSTDERGSYDSKGIDGNSDL